MPAVDDRNPADGPIPDDDETFAEVFGREVAVQTNGTYQDNMQPHGVLPRNSH